MLKNLRLGLALFSEQKARLGSPKSSFGLITTHNPIGCLYLVNLLMYIKYVYKFKSLLDTAGKLLPYTAMKVRNETVTK